jgi:4-diphosphocytidyl-2-C-methyl-D-erythritol kinase
VDKGAETQAAEIVGGTDSELARAKVNLALHVTGRRADGYHLISSLVTFAEVGDTIRAEPSASGRMSLTVEGPFAEGLVRTTEPQSNLVVRAASELAKAPGVAMRPTRLVLAKHLPVAAGLGGGSSDAAATLRLLARFWKAPIEEAALLAIGARLGADVPMCLHSRPLIAAGVGEAITPVSGLPRLALVLVNPGVPLSTAAVFQRLAPAERAPLPAMPERFGKLLDFVFWLRQTRNDLTAPAKAEARVVGTVIKALANDPDCLYAQMSGSGASAFGIFISLARAEQAAERLRRAREGWWVAAGLTQGS